MTRNVDAFPVMTLIVRKFLLLGIPIFRLPLSHFRPVRLNPWIFAGTVRQSGMASVVAASSLFIGNWKIENENFVKA